MVLQRLLDLKQREVDTARQQAAEAITDSKRLQAELGTQQVLHTRRWSISSEQEDDTAA